MSWTKKDDGKIMDDIEMLAALMAFITINNLMEDFAKFIEIFVEYEEICDEEFDPIKFKKYYDSRIEGEETRNA